MCVVSISSKARIHKRNRPTTPELWTTWHGCDLQATKFCEISYLRNPNSLVFLKDSRSVHFTLSEYAKKFKNISIFCGVSRVFNSVGVTRFISKLLQLFWLVTLIRRGCLFFRQECVSSLVQHQGRCFGIFCVTHFSHFPGCDLFFGNSSDDPSLLCIFLVGKCSEFCGFSGLLMRFGVVLASIILMEGVSLVSLEKPSSVEVPCGLFQEWPFYQPNKFSFQISTLNSSMI